MFMKSIKNYIIVHNESEIIIFDSLKNVEVSTPETNTIYESDSLQECIDYLLLNEIDTFAIPRVLTGMEIVNYKKIPVFENNILTKYIGGIPEHEDNVLTGYTEETDTEKILERKIKISNWEYPERPFRITGDVKLFFNGNKYESFKNQIDMRCTPYVYNEKKDVSTIYFDYLEKVKVQGNDLFTLTGQIITCSDTDLKLEQLYDSGHLQNTEKIYRS